MSKELDSKGSRIQRLEAYLAAAQGEAAKAVEMLSKDASIAGRVELIKILLQDRQHEESAAIARTLEPDDESCFVVVEALGANGEWEAASKVLDWTTLPKNRQLKLRSVVTFGQTLLRYCIALTRIVPPLLPTEVPAKLTWAFERAVKELRPFVEFMQSGYARERELTALDVQALELAVDLSLAFGTIEVGEELGHILWSRTPIPLSYGKLVMWGAQSVNERCIERLRSEHNSFPAGALAIVLEGKFLGKSKEAYQNALRLAATAQNDDEKSCVCSLLCQFAEESQLAEAIQVAATLLGKQHPASRSLEVRILLAQGLVVKARKLIDEIRDETSPWWWQLWGNMSLADGDLRAAEEAFFKAAQLSKIPDLFQLSASLAFKNGNIEHAIKACEQILQIKHNDLETRRNAAILCVRIRNFKRAAEHYRILCKLNTSDVISRINLAYCLLNAGDLDSSLNEFESICLSERPSLSAILGRAETLKLLNRHRAAYDSLKKVRSDFWNEPPYLMPFLQLAFRCGDDQSAHEALKQLHDLHGEGLLNSEVFRPVSIEEIKKHISEFNEKQRTAIDHVVRGHMPWLGADLNAHRAYGGWFERIQPVPWLTDEPAVRARHTIYSTNSFHLMKHGSELLLEPITTPKSNVQVVADLSALFTLHRLGLLDHALRFFGRIYVPASYLNFLQQEIERYSPHQPSVLQAENAIDKAVQSGRLKIIEDQTNSPNELIKVSEFEDETGDGTTKDIAHIIMRRQTGAHDSEANSGKPLILIQQPGGSSLEFGSKVCLSLEALHNVAMSGLMNELLDSFDVYLTRQDHQRVLNDIRFWANQAKIGEWNHDLIEKLSKDERFIHEHVLQDRNRTDFSLTTWDIILSALTLAKTKDASLFVDDRACQAIALNESNYTPGLAFGTDALLVTLANADVISQSEAAYAFLQLIEWRYRFLVMPAELIKYLANSDSEKVSADLFHISSYVHGCLRDVALPGGLEASDPPMPIAFKFYQAWAAETARLIIQIWKDASYSVDRCKRITRWGITELLPTTPVSLPDKKFMLSEMQRRLVLGHAVISASEIQDLSRGNLALQTIADCLNLKEHEYIDLIAEILNAI